MRDPPTPICCAAHRPLLLIVEGSHDASFLKTISQILAADIAEVPDLERLSDAGDVIFVPFGGGNPLPWTDRFAPLGCRELHLYDRELPPESTFRYLAAARVNHRPSCRAFLTGPRALENYLHPEAITKAGGACISFGLEDCVATKLAQSSAQESGSLQWRDGTHRERQKQIQRSKRWLNTVAVEHMTPALLAASDPNGDITRWLMTIRSMLPGREATYPSSNCGRSLAR